LPSTAAAASAPTRWTTSRPPASPTQATLCEIERLPKPERQALLLSALEDLSIAEIAHIMSKSESAVRALIFRARTRLRQRLAQGGQL
jgi:RNA polymerase sigma-70 factor (ECF subfamily)